MPKAVLRLRLWGDDVPDETEALAEIYREHAAHVARMLEDGYQSGQLIGDKDVHGWWEIQPNAE